jgi:hypothetical protein
MIDTQQQYIKLNIHGINNCGAGTLGQEKRYMHINVHTHTHIYIMMKKSRGWGWGDEREHIHISGDSSPICKRHLVSMLKGIKSLSLLFFRKMQAIL